MFEGTREAFRTQSEEKAREVLKVYERAKKGCDAVIEKTVRGERYGLTPGQAVVCALNARFLRRMASHLENINSSVLVPVHRLDFQPNGDNEDSPEDN
jgi:phosphate uptake regulator